MYTNEWKIVTYLDLQVASGNIEAVGKYIDFAVAFCMRYNELLHPNPPVCYTVLNTVKREYAKVQELGGLVIQLSSREEGTHRRKRGIFNAIGHLAHALFGLLDSDSEVFYNQKISKLEEDKRDWLKLIKEQTTVVRSTLNTVNHTLSSVSKNEASLTSQLAKIQAFVNVRNRKIENKYALTALVLALNDHAMRIRQAIRELYSVYTTVIQACLTKESGILQPQILSPYRLMEILEISQDSFPRDMVIPVSLSKAYAHRLLNIINVNGYLLASKFVYVVQVPLVMSTIYSVFKVTPFPMKVEGREGSYTLIQPDKEYLVIDDVKGFFAKLDKGDLQQCKEVAVKELICKQVFPMFSSHMTTDCVVQMLKPIRLVPESCNRKSLELKETLWIPLRENAWVYVAPVAERMTVLCPGQQATVLELRDSGILTFMSACTGYGNNAIIRALTVHSVSDTSEGNIQPLDLSHDCCDMAIDPLVLGSLNFETPVDSIPLHDEDLQVAAQKVETLERLVNDQETEQVEKGNFTMFSVFGSLMSVLFCVFLCCCCCLCRCCRNCWLRVMRWWCHDNSCKTIVFRPKIITSFCTSNDGGRGGRLSGIFSRTHIDTGSEGESRELMQRGPAAPQLAVGKR